jgi:hypothetical protein
MRQDRSPLDQIISVNSALRELLEAVTTPELREVLDRAHGQVRVLLEPSAEEEAMPPA